MLTAPLFAATLLLASTGEKSYLDVGASGRIEAGSATPAQSTTQAPLTMFGGSAAGGATLYFDPVIDDDTAPSLQPYLQRVGTFGLSAGGGSLTWSNADTPYRVDTVGSLSLGMDGYFGPRKLIYAGATFSFRYENNAPPDGRSSGNTTLTLDVPLSFGVRFGDTRVRVVYDITAVRFNDQSFTVPYWGKVGAHLYSVIRRRFELTAIVSALRNGVSGDLGAVVWLARRFGVGLDVSGGTSAGATTVQQRQWVQGSADFWVWLTPRFGLYAAYQPEWVHYDPLGQSPGESDVYHNVIVGLFGRPF